MKILLNGKTNEIKNLFLIFYKDLLTNYLIIIVLNAKKRTLREIVVFPVKQH